MYVAVCLYCIICIVCYVIPADCFNVDIRLRNISRALLSCGGSFVNVGPICAGPVWKAPRIGRGDDTVGNPHRAQIYQFELFEPILLLKLDKQLPVERFEATVSLSTVPSPPLRRAWCALPSGLRCTCDGYTCTYMASAALCACMRDHWPYDMV